MNLISTAHAAGEAAPKGGGMVEILMIFVFMAMIYFLIWRPQNKKQQEHRKLIGGLQKGDEIVTSGGMLGKISKVKTDFLVVSVAEGVELTLQKQAIANVLPKGTIKSAG